MPVTSNLNSSNLKARGVNVKITYHNIIEILSPCSLNLLLKYFCSCLLF